MARILIVDDEPNVRAALLERFEGRGHDVSAVDSGSEALEHVRRERPDVMLLDLQLPGGDGQHVLETLRREALEVTVVVITAFATIERAVEAMKAGAYDFIQKPFQAALLEETVRRALERTNHVRVARAERRRVEVIGLTSALELVNKAARSDATVLLLGESGSGKEVLARALHDASPRAAGPFVAVNAAAVVESLLESELFGHEKGAFTGADKRRAGQFELAHGGTLFLDEIGDVSPAMQAKLLRVLETREFARVGGSTTLAVDVRVVAATHRDIEGLVARGEFREDLYWRLKVLPIRVPPLRERRGDIATLARHFLGRTRPSWSFTTAAIAAFESYDWPGNVRELRNVIERAVALGETAQIDVVDLPAEIATGRALPPTTFHAQVEAFRARVIAEALASCGGNQTRAAEMLGLQRTYLARLIRQMRIESDTR